METTQRFSACHGPEQDVSETVGAALASVREFAAGCAIDRALTTRLTVVIDELVGNLLRHGRAPCGVHLAFVLERRDGEVTIVLEDDCLPFDPRTAVFVAPDAETGGGVGLALVRGLAEIVGYERRGGINRLTLRVRG